MRILMAGGGTAGHINPALAIASIIQKHHPDAEFLFIGAAGKMETKLVPATGFALKTVEVRGFQRRLSLKNVGRNISAAVHAVTSSARCAAIIKEFQPDIAIGTGGYVCGPALRKAAQMGVPIYVHEANAYPGVTTKMLAKYAETVMVADEAAAKYFPKNCQVVVTGNPLRGEFFSVDREAARAALGLDERPFILAYGGSLGARAINEAMTTVISRNAAESRLQIMHSSGEGGYDTMMKALGTAAESDGVQVRRYIDNMSVCMAAADLVICRCGAMTMSELPVLGKPAILVPSPYVAENHQYHNAMALVRRGAAVCLEEKNLTGERLWDEIRRLTAAPDTLHRMAENARKGAITDADERIYAVIRESLQP